MSANTTLTDFWFKLTTSQKASLATLCATMSKLRTPREYAEMVGLVSEPEVGKVFDGFGEGNDPLLLPILRVLQANPKAEYADVFERLLSD